MVESDFRKIKVAYYCKSLVIYRVSLPPGYEMQKVRTQQ